jgi:hypothetical protein
MSTPFATNDPQAGEQGPTKEVTFAESAGQVEQQQNSGIKREQSGFNLVASPRCARHPLALSTGPSFIVTVAARVTMNQHFAYNL